MELDQHGRSSKLHWQYYSRNRREEGIKWSGRRSSEEVGRELFVCKAREVQVESNRSRIFRSSNWTKENKNGVKKDKDSIRLANPQ